MQLDWETVSTKSIDAIATDGNDLFIKTYSKGILQYQGIAEEFEWLLSEYDVEEYYNKNIKGKYPFIKITDSELDDDEDEDDDDYFMEG